MKIIIVLLIILIIILLYKNQELFKENFNYKLVPNSFNSNIYINNGILKNIRKNRHLYSIKNEYKYNQFKSILTKIVKNIDFFEKKLKVPNIIQNILLSNINYYSNKSKFNTNIFIPFKIYDFNLIKSFSSKININKFHLYTKIYRKNKDYYFSLFIEVLEDIRKQSYLFTKISINGILMQDTFNQPKINT